MGVGNIDRNSLEGSHSSPPHNNGFGKDGIQVRRLLRLLTHGLTRQSDFWGRVCLGWLNCSNILGLGLGSGWRIRSVMRGFLALTGTSLGSTEP